MVLKTNMEINKKEEDPKGEMKLDHEGKGYWHSYKKNEKPKTKKEIVAEEKAAKEEGVKGDLNKDGKVDGADGKLASETMNELKKKNKGKNK